VKSAVGLN
jgi:hypothetical protein